MTVFVPESATSCNERWFHHAKSAYSDANWSLSKRAKCKWRPKNQTCNKGKLWICSRHLRLCKYSVAQLRSTCVSQTSLVTVQRLKFHFCIHLCANLMRTVNLNRKTEILSRCYASSTRGNLPDFITVTSSFYITVRRFVYTWPNSNIYYELLKTNTKLCRRR